MKAHKRVQSIAKQVLRELPPFINESSTEASIALAAVELLSTYGIVDTWYYEVPALVLLGSRSCLSISGKNYVPSTERVGRFNLVTVDVSPSVGNVWGDCARSFCVEEGCVTEDPITPAFRDGLKAELHLHEKMIKFVTPETTFSELYCYANDLIGEMGYENLDFHRNLGHSIEEQLSERKYIDQYCHLKLSDVKLFTFEPHIASRCDGWGFKMENIYTFNEDGQVVEL